MADVMSEREGRNLRKLRSSVSRARQDNKLHWKIDSVS